jgi:hypothetical protein
MSSKQASRGTKASLSGHPRGARGGERIRPRAAGPRNVRQVFRLGSKGFTFGLARL